MAKAWFKKGQVVGVVALRNHYDNYATEVLDDHLKQLKVPKGKTRKFKFVAEPPTMAVFQEMLEKRYATTVEALINDAFQGIEDLGEEVREIYDNMPEGLQQGDRGTRLEEAASACEQIVQYKPELPDEASKIKTVFLPYTGNRTGRNQTASECGAMMEHAANAIDKYLEGDEEKDEDLVSDLTTVKEELDTQLNEVTALDFPGMYG